MKIWLKLLVGICLGLLLAIFIPNKQDASVFLNGISALFIQIGRYAVMPLVFFSLIVGIYQLKVEKKILSTYRDVFFHSRQLYLLLSALSFSLFFNHGCLFLRWKSLHRRRLISWRLF